MPNLVESLQDIEEDRWAISAYFYIVYSFYNSMFYCCMFTSKAQLVIGISPEFSIIMEILENKGFSNSLEQDAGWSLYLIL